jgi:proline racemase
VSFSSPIEVVGCHAGGEVGDVIVGGVEPPPGATVWEQSRRLMADGRLRGLLLNEPRGGVFRHVNLLVPPTDPRADFAWIIMEPNHNPPMSGSNAICVATVLLETGRAAMVEPVTRLTLQAPGGLVAVEARCRGGKVERVTLTNLPSFAAERGVALEVEGLGTLQVDTAYGGDSFVVVDADALDLRLDAAEAAILADLGMRCVRAANAQIGFAHPENSDWAHISFCLFASRAERAGAGLAARHAVCVEPGKIDRSPTGTAVSARMALLHADGLMAEDDVYTARSIIGSEFEGRIAGTAAVGGRAAIVPTVSGTAWITGRYEYTLDPGDPFPEGYRIADTWPGA